MMLACGGARSRLSRTIDSVLQFRCIPLSRRFPTLKELKNESVVDILRAQRRTSGAKLAAATKAYPNTNSSTLAAQLYYTDGATPGKWSSNLHSHLGHLDTRRVPRVARGADGDDTLFVQRENEVWQRVGRVYSDRKRWLCCGRASAQHGVERPDGQVCAKLKSRSAVLHALEPTVLCTVLMCAPELKVAFIDRQGRDCPALCVTWRLPVQRYIADTVRITEHARALEAQREHAHAVKGACLAGEMVPTGGLEARELLRVKATLVSKDDDALQAELEAAIAKGQAARATFLQQTSGARGSMLHDAFPPAPLGPETLAASSGQRSSVGSCSARVHGTVDKQLEPDAA